MENLTKTEFLCAWAEHHFGVKDVERVVFNDQCNWGTDVTPADGPYAEVIVYFKQDGKSQSYGDDFQVQHLVENIAQFAVTRPTVNVETEDAEPELLSRVSRKRAARAKRAEKELSDARG